MDQESFEVPVRRKKSSDIWDFFWDPLTNAYCGRTCSSWGHIIIFYFTLYASLTGLFTACLMALHSTTRTDKPKYHIGGGQGGQPILVTPGMNYVPKSSNMMRITPVLSFSKSDSATYQRYLEQLRETLLAYKFETTRMLNDCEGEALPETCLLNPTEFGVCYQSNLDTFQFGYDQGKPCIALRINKLYNWVPELYTEDPDATNIGSRFSNASMPVTCEAFKVKKNDPDITLNPGDIDFFPEAGFPGSCFPFCGRMVPYLPPVVMIKLQNIPANTKVAIWCKFFAVDTSQARRQGLSSASFVVEIRD